MIKVGILGGSGYGGSELLRILLFHPQVEIKLVTANEHAGKRVDAVHPNLARLTELQFYGFEHTQIGAQRQFVYGLTEVNRAQIKEATRVANPGCFATALALGLYPFIASGVVAGKIIADLKTGSSGSGAKAAA